LSDCPQMGGLTTIYGRNVTFLSESRFGILVTSMVSDLCRPCGSKLPTMSNSMEVDAPQILGPAFTLTPSRPAVASPHPLQRDEIDELNLIMNEINWSKRIERAGDDTKKREMVIAQILIMLTMELASKANYFIEVPSRSQAEKLLESLDENGLKEWEDGVEAGIQNRDWARLACHCTLVVPYLEVWCDSSLHSDTQEAHRTIPPVYI
jgi:hypothetical protein